MIPVYRHGGIIPRTRRCWRGECRRVLPPTAILDDRRSSAPLRRESRPDATRSRAKPRLTAPSVRLAGTPAHGMGAGGGVLRCSHRRLPTAPGPHRTGAWRISTSSPPDGRQPTSGRRGSPPIPPSSMRSSTKRASTMAIFFVERSCTRTPGDPVELFYVAMARGFGSTNVRWPAQQAILNDPPRRAIEGIIAAVQAGGAKAGWTALFGDHRIFGLSHAFGTKLLYLAGYTSGCPGPRL